MSNIIKIYESLMESEILYHGTPTPISNLSDITSGFWMGTEPDSTIMNYYKSRGELVKLKFTPVHPVVDLTEYDVDEDLEEEHVKSFVVDILTGFMSMDTVYTYLYEILDSIEENIELRTNDEGDDLYTHSEVLNHIIKEFIIPNKFAVSGIRVYESGNETVVAFNKDELEIIHE